MVHFTFAAQRNTSSGFFIAHGQSMGWRNLPQDLGTELDDAREKGETVEHVSIGLDHDDWFIRTDGGHSAKLYATDHISNAEHFCREARDGGVDLSQCAIQQFTYVPNPAGYVVLLLNNSTGHTTCAWANVPRSLDRHLSEVAGRGVKSVAVGSGGSWVVILEDGSINWMDVPKSLSDILHAPLVNGTVEFVALSLSASDQYFVVYKNGLSDYALPSEWHAVVNSYRVTTPSFSYAQSHPQPGSGGYSLNNSYAASGYMGSPSSPYSPYSSPLTSPYGAHRFPYYTMYGMAPGAPAMPHYSAPQTQEGGHGIATASNVKTAVKVIGGILKFANNMQGGGGMGGGLGGGLGGGGFDGGNNFDF